MDNIISKMKYELGEMKYKLMVSKEKNSKVKNEKKKKKKKQQKN